MKQIRLFLHAPVSLLGGSGGKKPGTLLRAVEVSEQRQFQLELSANVPRLKTKEKAGSRFAY